MPAGTGKITFTSGSTGAPRGVCLGKNHQLRVARALRNALQSENLRHLCVLPMSTLLENVAGVYCPLLSAGSLICLPPDESPYAGDSSMKLVQLVQAIDRYQPASIILLPQMLVGLVAAMQTGWRAPPTLEFVAVGGAKSSPQLVRRAREYGLPVYEGYGLSEAGSVACLNVPGQDRVGSVGRPLSHVDLRVSGGEVVLSGNTCLGYIGEPSSWNAEQLFTGDVGRLDPDGFLHLSGRRKNLLISSFGRNVCPEWVESELLAMPAIEQCIVLGDGRPFCVALIYADPAIGNDELQRLIGRVNSTLPDYARVHRWRRLAQPLSAGSGDYTENGRPKRAAIAGRYADQIDELYARATT